MCFRNAKGLHGGQRRLFRLRGSETAGHTCGLVGNAIPAQVKSNLCDRTLNIELFEQFEYDGVGMEKPRYNSVLI